MAEVVATLQERVGDWLDGPIIRIGASDTPWPYNRNMEQGALPQSRDVLDALTQAYRL